MATYRHDEVRTGPRWTRWFVLAAVLIAIAVAVLLIVLYSGGGGGY